MRYANEFAYLGKRFGDAQEDVYRRAQQTTSIVERHVTPVFTYRPDGRLDFEGSGLLARLDGRYYLVTAAHVLDAWRARLRSAGCRRNRTGTLRHSHCHGTACWDNQG